MIVDTHECADGHVGLWTHWSERVRSTEVCSNCGATRSDGLCPHLGLRLRAEITCFKCERAAHQARGGLCLEGPVRKHLTSTLSVRAGSRRLRDRERKRRVRSG